MKKKLIAVLCSLCLVFTSCDCNEIDEKQEPLITEYVEGCDEFYCYINNTLFKAIDIKKHLYYSVDTKIVYVIMTAHDRAGKRGYGYGWMSAWYAPNGLPYRYIDGELVEINQ